MISLKKWFDAVELRISDLTQRELVKSYITNLHSKDIPVIFDLEHFSLLCGIKKRVLLSMIFNSNKFYYRIEIPKKTGGFRKLSIPFPALKAVQNWILREILNKQSVHSSVTAFYSGRSILDNVVPHMGAPHILKIDLKDFFPSIFKQRVITLFSHLGYHHKLSFFLASLCCEDNSLPQGAPTSPYISNLIFRNLDDRIHEFSTASQITYTRYADDLIFSGNQISDEFILYIKELISKEGFSVNDEKTRLSAYGRKRIITGISISSHVPKVPKSKKRKLRQEIFYIKKYGILNHMLRTNNLDPTYLDRIKGQLNFWKFVEPSNEYANRSVFFFKEIKSNN